MTDTTRVTETMVALDAGAVAEVMRRLDDLTQRITHLELRVEDILGALEGTWNHEPKAQS